MGKLSTLMSSAAIAFLAFPVASYAQTRSTVDGENDTASADIIVTANKREERLTDVASSISVLTGASLEQSGAAQFSEYFDKIPGLSMVSFGTAGRAIVSLRGISTGASTVNATVGTYINDVPFGSAGGLAIGGTFVADPNTFDIARVEVLKGPQGTLYGASTLGGLIKTVYNTPEFNRLSGKAMIDASTVEGGSQGFAVNAMANLSTSDRFALRAVVSLRRDPGFIDSVSAGNVRNDFNSADAMGARVIALFRPSENFTAEFTALYQYTHSKGINQVDLNPVTMRPTIGDLKTGETFIQPSDRLEYQIYAGKLIYDFGNASLTSVTSYGKFKDEATTDVTNAFGFGPLLPYNQTITLNNFTQEVRLASADNAKLEWLLGGFYTSQESGWNFDIRGVNPATRQYLVPEFNVYTFGGPISYREIAGFANATINITDRLGISLGGRYSGNRQRYSYFRSGLAVGNVTSTTVGTSSENVFTYSASIQYKPTENALIYAKTANGYRPGGPQVSNLAGLNLPTTYGADKTRNYEAGLKWGSVDRRFSIDLSAFYIDWTDIQLLRTVVVNVGGQVVRRSLIENAGKASSRGFDFNLSYRPVSGLTLSAGGGYTDARLDQASSGLGAAAGERIPYVPRWSANGSADYKFPLGGSATASLGGTIRYVGDRFNYFSADPSGYVRGTLPAYVLVDLRAAVNFDDFEVALRVNNVTNRRAIIAAQGNAFNANPPFDLVNNAGVVAQPRTYGISLTKSF